MPRCAGYGHVLNKKARHNAGPSPIETSAIILLQPVCLLPKRKCLVEQLFQKTFSPLVMMLITVMAVMRFVIVAGVRIPLPRGRLSRL